MSRVLVLVHPNLVTGFHLAGVEAYGAEDVESAQQMIEKWLQSGESALVAIEEELLLRMDPELVKHLDGSDTLLYVAIPGGASPEYPQTRRARISRLIQRAIGVHIAFDGDNARPIQ
jgi:vacuolar-type H+-ATPase subunit F/Vma7